MPSLNSGKVLVTGANGYIAVWIVKTMLEAGFSVRGTVRSASKADHLRNLFKSFGDKFEVVVVPDITNAESFTEYVKDVDAIAHTASPFHMNAIEPDELIIPAVEGTLSVLKAAEAHGPSVKRVIVLSSTAAVLGPYSGTPLDESHWNQDSIDEVKAKGRDAANHMKYRASKTLAERAAWEWYEERKSKLGWDLVALNPPFVFGPFLHEVASPEQLNTSAHDWYFNIVKGKLSPDGYVNGGACWVDVRDIATAHALALKTEAAAGRFIVAAGAFKWQDFATPAHAIDAKVPEGNPSAYDPSTVQHGVVYNSTKSKSVLGLKYHTVEETTKDTLQDFEIRGWL
ncbi:NAD(P)-binding protein [Epithele typhae]|uniref:NAD(P)-binding protein n=1 Tax=Epithele typhae TaxID=378194 RepID=UPI002007406B|nr:NAD(P)-binding protein [Epithele typhae]KAH9918737.1 NAD(P)-binding protein [Epithele typhae]